MNFDIERAVAKSKNWIEFLLVTWREKLYVINLDLIIPVAFVTRSSHKPTDFGTWYHWLVYTRPETIYKMAAQNLVDGLDIKGKLLIKNTCEDCIYSKQTA